MSVNTQVLATQKLNQFIDFLQIRDDIADNVLICFSSRGFVSGQESPRVTFLRYGASQSYGKNKKVSGFETIELRGQITTMDILPFRKVISLDDADLKLQKENLVNIAGSILKRNMMGDLENNLIQNLFKSAKTYECRGASTAGVPSTLSEENIRNVEIELDRSNCRRIVPFLQQPGGASRFNVSNVPSSFIFVVPTETQRTIQKNIPELVTPNKYGWSMVPYSRELGSVSNTRVIASNFLDAYVDKGASSTSPPKDVFTGFLFGFQSFATQLVPELTKLFFQAPEDISIGGTRGYMTSIMYGNSCVLNPNWVYKVRFTI